MRHRNEGKIQTLVVGIFALAVLLALASPVVTYSTVEWVYDVEVTKTERKVSNDSSVYMVYTRQETFQNADSILFFKFNSSDVYAGISAGSRCNFRVSGFRIAMLSSYRNIIEARCDAVD